MSGGRESLRPILGAVGLVLLWFGVLAIPLVEITTCTQGSEDAWLGSLFIYTPLSGIVVVLAWIGSTRRSWARWLSLPLVPLVPWAGSVAWKYLVGVTIERNHVCAVHSGEMAFNSYPSSWIVALWAPVQFCFLIAVIWSAIRFWRAGS